MIFSNWTRVQNITPVMNVVGETRSGAVVVVSKNKAGRTALESFYFIYVPRSVGVP